MRVFPLRLLDGIDARVEPVATLLGALTSALEDCDALSLIAFCRKPAALHEGDCDRGDREYHPDRDLRIHDDTSSPEVIAPVPDAYARASSTSSSVAVVGHQIPPAGSRKPSVPR